MTSNPVELHGLQGNNPFDFLAALGVQAAFEHEQEQPLLWWSDDVVPYPIVSPEFQIDRIAHHAQSRLRSWIQGTNLVPPAKDRAALTRWLTLKLDEEETRRFLSNATMDKYAGRFYMALVAEGSLDNNGASKPTDLYFCAGQQKFLDLVKEIIESVPAEEIVEDLLHGVPQELDRKTLLLDVSDDADYALSARNPSGAKKYLRPGVEALAILGLGCIPVFGSRNRTLTQGCRGSWKESSFEWPIWRQPASMTMVRSIMASTTPLDQNRAESFDGWSVARISRSVITRTSQGGYGTFRPAQISWANPLQRKKSEKKKSTAIAALDRASVEAQSNGLTREKLTDLIESDD